MLGNNQMDERESDTKGINFIGGWQHERERKSTPNQMSGWKCEKYKADQSVNAKVRQNGNQ